MDSTRRDTFAIVSGLLAAASTAGQEPNVTSLAYRFEELPARSNGPNVTRPILNGITPGGAHLEAHETELAPGKEPHPPHRHKHEEMVIVYEGEVEFTVAGRSKRLGPGGVAFAASNDEHGLRNPTDSRARYVVIAIGPRK